MRPSASSPQKGYHTCRVGDIAEEAGIAHGLLYHYFASKEEVLETVFRENWSELLDAFDRIEASDEPPVAAARRRSRRCCSASWRDRPDLVTVMVREVARSPQLQGQVDEIRGGFLVIQRVIERGQADGSFRPELDARLASWIFYGGLEELLTGWVLGPAPGRRRGGGARRADGDRPRLRRADARRRRSSRLSLSGRAAGRAGAARTPRAVVEDVERGRRAASGQDEDGVAAALAPDERAVDRGDAHVRVAEREAAVRPPAQRLVDREDGGDAAAAQLDAGAAGLEREVVEVPGLGGAAAADAVGAAPASLDLGLGRAQLDPAEAAAGDEHARFGRRGGGRGGRPERRARACCD